MMNDRRKSDDSIVPKKPTNEPRSPGEESVEERESRKGNTEPPDTRRTQRRTDDVQNGLDRIRAASRKDPEARFTALLHHVTVDRLREAFLALRLNAAPGVDG